MTLIDQQGRQIKKLRISLTDRCNLRCSYCMPENAVFMDPDHELSVQETYEIVKDLVSLGLTEVRLTGGEPLLSPKFEKIASLLSALPLKKLALTTNGILLDKHFSLLKSSGIKSLNISLDSLKPQKFLELTKRDMASRVIENILEAHRLGFQMKINAVIMRNKNFSEILDFVEFSEMTGIEIRFLELMKIGFACTNQESEFVAAHEILSVIKSQMPLKKVEKEADSTSFNYQSLRGAQIGFIASESNPFCGHCSRWRLSSSGILRACLFKEEGLSLKDKTKEERYDIYQKVLGMKPILRSKEVSHHMNEIGG